MGRSCIVTLLSTDNTIECLKEYKTLKGDLMSLSGIDVGQRDSEAPSSLCLAALMLII